MLTLAALAWLLCGLFLHSQGFVPCGGILAVVVLLGLVVFSVVAPYIHYPDRKQVFDEIMRFRVPQAALLICAVSQAPCHQDQA